MNVLSVLERIARRRAEHVALRCDDSELTYEQLLASAASLAGFLVDNGLRPGDRVAIHLHNQPEYLPAILGIWKAGGVVVPLNFLLAPTALRHAVEDSGAEWLIGGPEKLPLLQEALAGLGVSERIITTTPTDTGSLALRDVLEHPPLDHTVPRMDGDDAVIMYTSGSTGRGKGVRQTHRNCVAASEATIDAWELTEDDHALVCTPLFHVGGLQLISLPTLLAGGTVTLRRWQVHEFLDDALRLRPTVLAIVPAMMIDIVNKHEPGRPLTSVRVCAIGGSAMPAARLEAFTRATGIVPVNIYGQTEQSGLAICEPLHAERREGALGLPLSQILDYRIVPVGSIHTDAGAARTGELWVRGDAVTPGYWNLPEVNAEKFVDGWFRTSDIMSVDDDGYLYYVERTDDMIISGGENLYPQMIEGLLQACELIAEVAVIGTRDERLSQQVTAIVVPAVPGVTVEDIAAYCESRPDLRGLQRPRRIEIVPEIARTATNKIDRPALRQQFR